MSYPRYYKRMTYDTIYPIRIMAPDESIMILKQQSGVMDEMQQQPSPRSKILRRKSSRREKDVIKIMAPDESIMILKQQSGVMDEMQQQPSPRSKILRRKSSRREKDVIK
ncbi:unnamed protein product [Strongylus vulgaris]|uniref:Uncharacterized protein n=1 Tax=Strongylus vulgaris TaxID=40348 RepID=A0A3P7JLJ1_STRVU|nr:unnamed protein product [Strongylus vulgaris]